MLEQLRKHFENLEEGTFVEDDKTGKGLTVLYEKDARLLATVDGTAVGLYYDMEKAFEWLLKPENETHIDLLYSYLHR